LNHIELGYNEKLIVALMKEDWKLWEDFMVKEFFWIGKDSKKTFRVHKDIVKTLLKEKIISQKDKNNCLELTEHGKTQSGWVTVGVKKW